MLELQRIKQCDQLGTATLISVTPIALRLNIPDTTGWNTPWEFGELIATLRARLGTSSEHVVFSTHCQNDLGLASANSLISEVQHFLS